MWPMMETGKMRLSEIIVALNSLKFDLPKFNEIVKDDDLDYYHDVLSEVQSIIINLDR